LADMIIEGEWKELAEIERADILMPYEKATSKKEPVKAGA